ncbi:hypothetical protein Patl1_02936 [Pistacia atlantica]|uniref:Uncharacterized protein n=1 Tax=Pistacia atlantica TaxID=434234 RepID=A0ACC1C9D4_9ROSI|nr:hypothetical protein Patl1_02936 [Pistacia atlantica]
MYKSPISWQIGPRNDEEAEQVSFAMEVALFLGFILIQALALLTNMPRYWKHLREASSGLCSQPRAQPIALASTG